MTAKNPDLLKAMDKALIDGYDKTYEFYKKIGMFPLYDNPAPISIFLKGVPPAVGKAPGE